MWNIPVAHNFSRKSALKTQSKIVTTAQNCAIRNWLKERAWQQKNLSFSDSPHKILEFFEFSWLSASLSAGMKPSEKRVESYCSRFGLKGQQIFYNHTKLEIFLIFKFGEQKNEERVNNWDLLNLGSRSACKWRYVKTRIIVLAQHKTLWEHPKNTSRRGKEDLGWKIWHRVDERHKFLKVILTKCMQCVCQNPLLSLPHSRALCAGCSILWISKFSWVIHSVVFGFSSFCHSDQFVWDGLRRGVPMCWGWLLWILELSEFTIRN